MKCGWDSMCSRFGEARHLAMNFVGVTRNPFSGAALRLGGAGTAEKSLRDLRHTHPVMEPALPVAYTGCIGRVGGAKGTGIEQSGLYT